MRRSALIFLTLVCVGVLAPTAMAARPLPVRLSLDLGAGEGLQTVLLKTTTAPGALCKASVRARKSRATLPRSKANPKGIAGWQWALAETSPSGTWRFTVDCRLRKRTGKAQASALVLTQKGKSDGPIGAPNTLTTPPDAIAGLGAADRFQQGQCTWMAWKKRPDVYDRGVAAGVPAAGSRGTSQGQTVYYWDGGMWFPNAQRAGIPTGQTPVVGALVGWGPYPGNPWGHIAYVEQVDSPTNIRISECNGFNLTCRTKWINPLRYLPSLQGYIYGGPAGDGPTSAPATPPPPLNPDQDEVPGAGDYCPNASGSAANSGCPSPLPLAERGIARGDFNGDGVGDVATGAPGEDVAGLADAGAVSVAYGSPTGLTGPGQLLYQALGQSGLLIGGGAEAGDYVGAALAAGDFDHDGFTDLAVGVPGEAIGALEDAGAVSVIYGSPSGLSATRAATFWQGAGRNATADLAGIAGAGAEAGDYVGAALAAGDVNGDGFADLLIGAPGEAIGTLEDAGAISLVPGSLDFARSATYFQAFESQPGGILPDVAEAGDSLGGGRPSDPFS